MKTRKMLSEDGKQIFEIDKTGEVVNTFDVVDAKPKGKILRTLGAVGTGVLAGFAGTACYKIGKRRGYREGYAAGSVEAQEIAPTIEDSVIGMPNIGIGE